MSEPVISTCSGTSPPACAICACATCWPCIAACWACAESEPAKVNKDADPMRVASLDAFGFMVCYPVLNHPRRAQISNTGVAAELKYSVHGLNAGTGTHAPQLCFL